MGRGKRGKLVWGRYGADVVEICVQEKKISVSLVRRG